MIYTGNYKNFKDTLYVTCSISGDRGKDANYEGKCYPALAPKRDFWKVWKNNIGIIPEEENTRYYIHEFYEQVLSKLDPEEVYRELDHNVLLCYEEPQDFCHRHLVAAWLELLLDIEVIEFNGKTKEQIEVPSYMKDWLEEEMKKKNMHGFESVRAAYLFEKGDRADAKGYGQYAAYLRSDADMVEEEYKANKAKLKQKK